MFRLRTGEVISNDMYAPLMTKSIMESDGLERLMKPLVEQADAQIKGHMQAQSLSIQMHLLALQCANYYVLAHMLTGSNQKVLQTICHGFSHSFASIFDPDASLSHPMVAKLYELMMDYGDVIWSDIVDPQENDLLSPSRCGKVFAQNIIGQCGIEEILSSNPVERMRIELIGHSIGVVLVYSLEGAKLLSYLADEQ